MRPPAASLALLLLLPAAACQRQADTPPGQSDEATAIAAQQPTGGEPQNLEGQARGPLSGGPSGQTPPYGAAGGVGTQMVEQHKGTPPSAGNDDGAVSTQPPAASASPH